LHPTAASWDRPLHEATKEKVRYAALMSGLKQAELVGRAVDEYVDRHRNQFALRMERAQQALLDGEADVQRLGGVSSDQPGSRSPRRATSNQASSPEGQSARDSHSTASAAAKARGMRAWAYRRLRRMPLVQSRRMRRGERDACSVRTTLTVELLSHRYSL
jgi:hypothetical protein